MRDSLENLYFHVEVSLSLKEAPQMSRSETVSKSTIFSVILERVLSELILDAKPTLSDWIIKTGIPKNTHFFPIAMNESQKNAWKLKLNHTKRILIPKSEWNSPYEIIVAKYQITEFHLIKSLQK